MGLAATRRFRLALTVTLSAILLLLTSLGPATATSGRPTHHPATTMLTPPSGLRAVEPSIAMDRARPGRVVVASMLTPLNPPSPIYWHAGWSSADAGTTWSLAGPMGGTDNGPDGIAADPVVAVSPRDQILMSGIVVDVGATGLLTSHVGTRISTDGGRSFTDFGSAEQVSFPPSCLAGISPCEFLDKPWMAVDTTHGPYRGSVYVAWAHRQLPSGFEELRVAVSRDGGRSYRPPLVLQHTTTADVLPTGFGENPQLAVRADGTVDAVWNGLRGGAPYILHAASADGGQSFSQPEQVVRLDPTASRRAIVPTLAVSATGRLGLCWAQSVAADPAQFDPRVSCVMTNRRGSWQDPRRPLPDNRDLQYLPAATFQRERLWVAAYVANASRTRIVAASTGEHAGAFAPPITLSRWAVGADHACPGPPEACDPRFFIGDYIGAVATRHRVLVAYIEPVVDPSTPSRVLVTSFTSP